VQLDGQAPTEVLDHALDFAGQIPTGDSIAGSTTVEMASGITLTPGDASPNGRKVTVAAITDGTVTGTDDATHWAITDTVNSRLLATGSLSAGQLVTSGNTYTLAAFDVRIPDPA